MIHIYALHNVMHVIVSKYPIEEVVIILGRNGKVHCCIPPASATFMS